MPKVKKSSGLLFTLFTMLLLSGVFLNVLHPQTFAQNVPTSGLVGHWTFDEASGNVALDSSGNNHSGNLVAGPTRTTSGQIGGAINFDGINDYVDMQSDYPLLDNPNNLSVFFWVKLDKLNGNQVFVDKYDSVGNNREYFIRATNQTLQVLFGNPANGLFFGSASSTANVLTSTSKFYHVGFTFESGVFNLYVDGVNIPWTGNVPTALFNGTKTLNIGAENQGAVDQGVDGTMDDVRIYNRALTALEVQALYSAGTVPQNAAPIASVGVSTSPTGPFLSSLSVLQNTPTTIYFSGENSSDPDGWTSTNGVSTSGSCEWNSDLDTLTTAAWATRVDSTNPAPVSSLDCVASGNFNFSNAPGNYTFDVLRVVDNNGLASNIATTQITITTPPPPPDTQAPTEPTNLTATPTSASQVNLTWTASTDNVGVTGYEVERCENAGCSNYVNIANTTSTSYTDNGLTASTAYEYRVRAVDAAANASLYSPVASVVTGVVVPNTNEDFTVVFLPDTQYYSELYPGTFDAQAQWIVNNKNNLNIVFVSHLGDVVEHSDQNVEWLNASSSMSILDNNNIPYGIAAGNHDLDRPWDGLAGTWNAYLQHFPPSRSNQKPWWGGYYQQGNSTRTSNYQLISVGGLDFIFLHLEYQAPDDVLNWARGVLQSYPNRRAIVSTHYYLEASGQRNTGLPNGKRLGVNFGEDIWQELVRSEPNIFMVHSAHISSESRLTSTNNAGKSVYQILTDFQAGTNGGDGWLRYYVFKPSLNEIHAFTYSPTLGQFDTDAESQFILPYDMIPPPPDTQAPTEPTNLTATPTSASQVNLTWTASTDNVGVTGYEVERCENAGCSNYVNIANTTSTSYTDNGLTASTAYEYRVRAVDAAANASLYSPVASVVTGVVVPPTSVPGLISHWKFDEGAGTIAGDSVGTISGTILGGAQWTTGKSGSAILFDGINDNVSMGSPTLLDDRRPYTITAWINPDIGYSGNILSKRKNGQAGFWHININSISNNIAWLKDTSQTPTQWVQTGANVLSANNWQQIALSWDGTLNAQGVKVYVNGTEVGSYLNRRNGTGALLSDAAANFNIGSRDGVLDFFEGKIDEVRVYDRVLSDTEIQTVYNSEL